jgi:hypothetical protein
MREAAAGVDMVYAKRPHEMIVHGGDAMASRRNFDNSNRRS